MIALGIAIFVTTSVILAYLLGREVGREETEVDRYCSRIDQECDESEDAERARRWARGET